jgi:hypothetical protein
MNRFSFNLLNKFNQSYPCAKLKSIAMWQKIKNPNHKIRVFRSTKKLSL